MVAEKQLICIFDFDGTMADTVPIIREIYSDLATKRKWRPLNDEDYEILRRGSLRDARRWSGIPFLQLLPVADTAKKGYRTNAAHLANCLVAIFRNLHRLKVATFSWWLDHYRSL